MPRPRAWVESVCRYGTPLAAPMLDSFKEIAIKHAIAVTVVTGIVMGSLVQGDRAVSGYEGEPIVAVPSVSSAGPSMAGATPPQVLTVRSMETSRVIDPEPRSLVTDAFSREILRMAAEADRLDAVWQIYKEECGVVVDSDSDFGREWFALLSDGTRATAGTPACADVPIGLSQAAFAIRDDLRRARDVAREAGIGQATEIGLLRWNQLELKEAR
jgi:hypothetical protein